VFNLSYKDVATNAAIALKADKLVLFTHQDGLLAEDGRLLRSLELDEIYSMLDKPFYASEKKFLQAIVTSVEAGISRCHCVSFRQDGALLQELFTRDGAGSLVSKGSYEQLRQAQIEDVGGVLKLIQPLEDKGALVKRSREHLEHEIEQFILLERDGMTIACAALYPYIDDKMGELACVAIHNDYRGGNRGERLLDAVKQQAQKQGLRSIFVLTTVTAHWFQEQGFIQAKLDDLPPKKKQLYNYQRKSKVFILAL
jgi:amino-acid N-acetyltransferase